MNENYTIPAFAEPITDLPDTPGLTAAELKRRFQAPADEVRLAHNALAECVEGITSATYPDTVTEDMLTDALADKINGKAEQSDLAAEIQAREQTDAAVALKCRMVCGTYTGNDSAARTITVGFAPKAVLVVSSEARIREDNAIWGGLALAGSPVKYNAIACTSNGFQVKLDHDYSVYTNLSGNTYFYIAFE